jgi:GGDEF domain-containing protein
MKLLKRLLATCRSESSELPERVRREADRSRQLAIYDQQSGLLSPWYFQLRVLEECRRCRRYGHAMALLAFDAANLGPKPKAGDWTLWESVAISSLMEQVRETDLVGALGGSEFIVCLVQCDAAGAARFLQRVAREGTEAWEIGLAVFPDEQVEGKELIALARSRRHLWESGEDLARAA